MSESLIKAPLNVENININLLKPYSNNAKAHPEFQIQQIASSIRVDSIWVSSISQTGPRGAYIILYFV